MIARHGARARLADAARTRNDEARAAIAALIERGDELYGVTTGVGALRSYRVSPEERDGYAIRLLRSHACAAGPVVPAELVRAAMVARANQIGAGGAGVAAELLDALVAALNAGLGPFTRELGSLGTGDLTSLADIALALLGEGQVWRGDELVDAALALAQAQITPGRLGPRDGLAFISSNAVTVGRAALLVVDVRRLLDAWLSVAALSFEAAAADPVVLDERIHSALHRPGPVGRRRPDARAAGRPSGADARSRAVRRPGSVSVPRSPAGRRRRPRCARSRSRRRWATSSTSPARTR